MLNVFTQDNIKLSPSIETIVARLGHGIKFNDERGDIVKMMEMGLLETVWIRNPEFISGVMSKVFE